MSSQNPLPLPLLSSALPPCPVESWAFCVSDCPSPLEDTRIGQTLPLTPPPGGHSGSFLARAASQGRRDSMGECCRFCTEFNKDHFGDIFGYTCDYWSWEADTGLCSLYDKAMVCRSPSHLIIEVFNATRENVLSFPAAC